MNNIPTQVWVTWFFALWWVIVGIRDYISQMSPRYKNGRALYLALVAAGQLAWLGFLLLETVDLLVLVVLIAFAITWILWVREARSSKQRDQ